MESDERAVLWILGGLGAILLAAFLSWFIENFERRTEEIDSGYSASARRNPFLAAERFLARLDIPVESLPGRDPLRDLPPPGDILVVSGMGVLNKKRQEALHQWIKQGGHLIVEATDLWEEDDPSAGRGGAFLARYGVRLLELEEPQESLGPDDEVTAAVNFDGYPYELAVGFTARFYLEDGSGNVRGGVSAEDRSRLLQYEIGDGMLTVTSDYRFLTNRHIGRHDNALFLALLTSPSDSGKVWLLYDSGMPWLGALLWRGAPLAIVSLLCLLALSLWYLGRRLGPFAPSPVGDRRDLLAHLQASAAFLWRHGQGSRLIESSRERIEQAWLRRYPTLRKLDQAGRVHWIARHAGIPRDDVVRALYPTAVNEGALITDTVSLQRLWSSLSATGIATPFSGCEADTRRRSVHTNGTG